MFSLESTPMADFPDSRDTRCSMRQALAIWFGVSVAIWLGAGLIAFQI